MGRELVPIQITCRDCEDAFIFTTSEQRFFAERALVPPKRCRVCRAIARAEREDVPAEAQR